MMRQRKSSVPAASASAVETNNGYQRIHVSGITGALKASDLEQLFSKVCKVEEVYIPEPDCLGCSRGFAVVRVAEDKSKALQCIKNFNGSVWKGSKLRLAFAKEWYRERLDREKVEDQDKQEKLDLLAKEKDNKISQLMAKFKIPAWSSNMLRIRKARTLPKIKVCSQPKVILGTETYYSKAANAICKPYNKKIIFDDASFLEAVQAAAYIPEAEYKKKLIPKPTKASAETSKTTPVPSSAASKNNSTQNATSVVPASTLPKPAGGKGRQGFGTLLSVPLPKCIEEKVDCCIDDEEEERNRNSKNRRKNISEHDDFAENSFEIVYPNDDTPCMTAEELEDSVLQAERQRALNVALLLLQENETKDKQRKEPTPRAKPTAEDKAAKDKAKRADTNDSATKGSNATGEEQPSQEVINDIITQNPNAYVNISTFKNIFQKEVS